MKYLVKITSVPDREKLVAEIWDNDQMIAEINQEQEELKVEIYFGRNEQKISLHYDDFVSALKAGKKKLLV